MSFGRNVLLMALSGSALVLLSSNAMAYSSSHNKTNVNNLDMKNQCFESGSNVNFLTSNTEHIDDSQHGVWMKTRIYSSTSTTPTNSWTKIYDIKSGYNSSTGQYAARSTSQQQPRSSSFSHDYLIIGNYYKVNSTNIPQYISYTWNECYK